ncbi:hypothetical protein AB9K26_06700 [Psychroserpens sp. XS_ASV72]|uniref:hypothetical protein n=1 Tax=Psychroserpens sp. XS_ASV72 TaxID=3241293 RepID=UPI0035169891
MSKEQVSIKNGNSNTNLGQYRGTKKPYDTISIDGNADIKPSHIKSYSSDNSDYLEQIDVELKKVSANLKINLFQINTCNDGKTLELHIATGSQLTSENNKLTFKEQKKLLLHSDKNSEEFEIKFVVYNYKTGNESDLYIYECETNTGKKIPVYNEITKVQKGNIIISHDPDTKKGSIIVGLRP